jgi:hypothetical protein
MKKILIFLLAIFVTCGPSEEEIQTQIDAAVEEALKEVTTTSTTTTTIYCELKTNIENTEYCLNKYEVGKIDNFLFENNIFKLSHIESSKFVKADFNISYKTEMTKYFSGSPDYLESKFTISESWSENSQNIEIESVHHKYGSNILENLEFKMLFDNDFECIVKYDQNNLTFEGKFQDTELGNKLNDAFGKQLSNLCNVKNLNDDLEVLDTLEIPCPTEGCYDTLPIIESIEFENLNFKFGDEPIFEVKFDNPISFGSSMWRLQIFYECEECFNYPDGGPQNSDYGSGSNSKKVDNKFYVFFDNLKSDYFTKESIEFLPGLNQYGPDLLAITEFYIAEEDVYCSIEYYTNGQYRSGENNYGCKTFSGEHTISLKPFTIEK